MAVSRRGEAAAAAGPASAERGEGRQSVGGHLAQSCGLALSIAPPATLCLNTVPQPAPEHRLEQLAPAAPWNGAGARSGMGTP